MIGNPYVHFFQTIWNVFTISGRFGFLSIAHFIFNKVLYFIFKLSVLKAQFLESLLSPPQQFDSHSFVFSKNKYFKKFF